MPEIAVNKRTQKLEDYDAFVDKFKPKKTTDDCYTPPEIYNVVRDWVDKNIIPLEGREVVRPFFPGGDYENHEYPEGCVVVDNPPFSILTKIVRFYNDKGIRFFLFAPTLTLFEASGTISGISFIVCYTKIVYENGATIPTSFVTNIPDEPHIHVCNELTRMINQCTKSINPVKARKRIYYPDNVISSAKLHALSLHASLKIPLAECHFIRKIDNYKVGLYGAGFLISERAAAEKAAAEKAAAERAAAERAAAEKMTLSPREMQIVKSLSPS